MAEQPADTQRTSQGALAGPVPMGDLRLPELDPEVSLGSASRRFLKSISLQRMVSVFDAADRNIADQIELAADMEESCDHLEATLRLRRAAVMRLDVLVQAGNPDDPVSARAAELAEKMVGARWFTALREWLLRAVFQQHTAAEILYRSENGLWMPAKQRAVEPRRWHFDTQGNPCFHRVAGRCSLTDLVVPWAGKYALHSYAAVYGQPGRYALVRTIAKLWFLGRLGLTGWGGMIDSWAAPFVHFQYREPMSREELARVIDTFMRMAAQKCAATPEGVNVNLHDVPDQTPHAAFQDFYRRAVSKFLLGQDTSQNATQGQQTGATVQGQVRDDLRDEDAALLDASLNESVFAPWCVWNFGPAVAPPTIKHVVKESVSPEQRGRVFETAQRLGLRLNSEQVYGDLGLDRPEGTPEVLEPPATQPGAGAVPPSGPAYMSGFRREWAPGRRASVLAHQSGTPLAAPFEPILAAVRTLAEQCSTAEEFRRRLPELIGSGGDGLVNTLDQVTFGAYCAGRLDTADRVEANKPQAKAGKGGTAATVGARLRELRSALGMSARALSVGAGLGPAYVHNVEAGRFLPKPAALTKLAARLGLSERETGSLFALANYIPASSDFRLLSGENCTVCGGSGLLGAEFGEGEIQRGRFAEAIDSFAQRTDLMPKSEFLELHGQNRARAWTVARVAEADVIKDLHGAVGQAIEGGQSWREFQDSLGTIMQQRGWEGLEPWHARLVYQQNVDMAHSAGRVMQATDAGVQYWRKLASPSAHPRPEHARYDGQVFAFAQKSPPPWAFGCQCPWEVVFDEELTPADRKAAGRELGGADQLPGAGEFEWDASHYFRPVELRRGDYPDELWPVLRSLATDHNALLQLRE